MKLFSIRISKQERDRIAAKIVVTAVDTIFLFGAFWGFVSFMHWLVNVLV